MWGVLSYKLSVFSDMKSWRRLRLLVPVFGYVIGRTGVLSASVIAAETLSTASRSRSNKWRYVAVTCLNWSSYVHESDEALEMLTAVNIDPMAFENYSWPPSFFASIAFIVFIKFYSPMSSANFTTHAICRRPTINAANCHAFYDKHCCKFSWWNVVCVRQQCVDNDCSQT